MVASFLAITLIQHFWGLEKMLRVEVSSEKAMELRRNEPICLPTCSRLRHSSRLFLLFSVDYRSVPCNIFRMSQFLGYCQAWSSQHHDCDDCMHLDLFGCQTLLISHSTGKEEVEYYAKVGESLEGERKY